MERLLGAKVNLDAEQFLEILNQARVVHQAAARFPGDEQVEVALFVGFPSRHGTEHADAMSAVQPGEPEDLLPPFRAQGFQRDHDSIL